MSQASQPGEVPLRPGTFGELLDAGVAVLRTRWRWLLPFGLLLATVEQLVLFPLRRLADLDLRYLPADDRWHSWMLLVVIGLATEAFVIALLAGAAGRGIPRALLGRGAPAPPTGARPVLALLLVAGSVALLLGLAAATIFGWPATLYLLAPLTLGLCAWVYGAAGSAPLVVMVERRGPVAALGRSLVLAHRGVLRVLLIRVLAYLAWGVIRVAWGFGLLGLIGLFYVSPHTTMDNILTGVVFLLINVLAYPMLGSLDASLYVAARVRTEGLDLALRRAVARRVDPTPVLAPTAGAGP
ncbi:hypothetical protein JQS43_06395 [Natronosporangium hydrolyticum]|uniref:Uncharacterized protein n=1 Tax=Natronosporangium hydrolyticum TaxID=2811111 RepID=A0A895YDV7_9ACTN|nr:hypothetical protein [Natronosporangium hydrolyticum]QSB15957.1 hypothetical protein JQS43_06395 [Natronosporangium hydrolyticum]